jgi:hypothetical protein
LIKLRSGYVGYSKQICRKNVASITNSNDRLWIPGEIVAEIDQIVFQ